MRRSLSLARLTRQHAVRIVSQQPGAGSLPTTLVDRIVERSDGIPLFAEELTRSIVDFEDTLEAVPSTLQASLTARLDRLHEVREVAQAAAVIGREFELDLLRELLSLSRTELLKAMEKILASKLVLRRAPSDLGSLSVPARSRTRFGL
jgi:predicted ATPase